MIRLKIVFFRSYLKAAYADQFMAKIAYDWDGYAV